MIAENTDPTLPNLLLVNVGNSRVALATWHDDKRSDAHHVPADSIGGLMREVEALWASLPKSGVKAMVVGSVCPPMLEKLRASCQSTGIEPILVVGEDLPQPMRADVDAPEKVGTDRLCSAAGAFARTKGACIVADFGTALTVDLVADNGVFLGGTILPGVSLSARALHEHTAQLPMVEMTVTSKTLGKNTEDAIRNGIWAMLAGALREIAERYATDVGKWPPLVLTGGDAEAMARHCDFVDAVMPDLYLDGLVIAYQQWHQRQTDDE